MDQFRGYIKLYRSVIHDPVWRQTRPTHKAVLLTVLLRVNYVENEFVVNGKKIHLKPGQCFISQHTLAEDSGPGITEKVVRSALKKFQNLNFWAYQGAKDGTVITIRNWTIYQSNLIEKGEQMVYQRANQGRRIRKKEGKNVEYIEDKEDGEIVVKNGMQKVRKEGEPEVKKEDHGFDVFWNDYHRITKKPKTDKDPALKKWAKLTKEEKEKALTMIGEYAKTNKPQYLKKARTYLEDKTFNDEFVTNGSERGVDNSNNEFSEFDKPGVSNYDFFQAVRGKAGLIRQD